jgi:hypothetical protein
MLFSRYYREKPEKNGMDVGETGNTYKILIGNPEQKRPFGIGEKIIYMINFLVLNQLSDRLCGLVVRALQIWGPGFDFRHYQKKKRSGSGTWFTQPREYN